MRATLAPLLAVTFFLSPSICRADYGDLPSQQDPPAHPPADPPRPMHWYGYETLATDGAALLLSVPALTSSASGVQSIFGVGSALTYGLGAPIIHFVHGRVGVGFADLGLRVGMPVILGFVGAMVGAGTFHQSSCSASAGGFCGIDNAFGESAAAGEGLVVGGLLGIGGAVVVDSALLAYEPVKLDDRDDAAPRAADAAPHIEPAFGVAPERQGGARATLGVLGTF